MTTLQNELDAGETLLWQGAPDPARLAQRNLWQAAFGGCFTCFALFWMGGAFFISSMIAGATGWRLLSAFPLFGLIFLVVGLGLLFSPLTAMKRGSSTVYAVTDRRLIVLESGKVLSYSPSDLQTLERRDTPDGRGDLVFQRRTSYSSEGHSSVREIGFFGIPNPREVERLVRAHLKH